MRQLASLLSYRELVYLLIVRDLRVRYKRSLLGLLWAFIEPLALMALFRVSTRHYPMLALCGIIAWSFFQTGVGHSLSAITAQASLVKKVYFPREVLPLAVVLGRFVHCLLSWGLLIPFLAYFHIRPTLALCLFPVVVLVQLVFVAGLSLGLSALSTLYEDIAFLVNFAFGAFFYLSGVFFTVEAVPESLRPLFLLNPMAAIITAYRALVLGSGPMPWQELGVAAIVAVLTLALGYSVFKRVEWRFVEVL